MSPPLSRSERDDPPPRRKSCQACVKAKRRCDQRSPACLRCAQRKIQCQYPARPSRRPTPSEKARSPLPPGVLTTSRLESQQSGIAGRDERLPNAGDGTAQGMQWSESLWLGGAADGLQFNEVDLGAVEGQGPLLSPSFDDISSTAFLGQDDIFLNVYDSNIMDYDPTLAEAGASPTTMHLAARPPLEFSAPRRFDVDALHHRVWTRLSYAIEQIKAAPRMMLLETATPWCHPLLYKEHMPRVMQDAISSCALYMAKNAINAPVVMSCIDTRVSDLLESPPPEDPIDALARTQALLLYQIIRCFDGDITARASADATFSELRSSVSALSHHFAWTVVEDEPGSLGTVRKGADPPAFPLQPWRESWKEWAFHESARRTSLVASFFIKTWRRLTGQDLEPLPACQTDPRYGLQSWTLSAHLWRAGDAYEFSLAWREREHYVVTRKTITSTLAGAGPDDIEPFGKMLLATTLGVDEAKAWLGMIGAAL
ncbi:hypothetical protein VPNG_08430 [Cytospora leucostoma]|uniref:Zn(2)-C6 fungal-type domain-containing protein n=1 Tax=Cytospora leucostoma TaxID=1230097 RepID=A0A423W628_9PEZI|nr:hypothetical protein VPNG_08430 [Cytospora leucostoma]